MIATCIVCSNELMNIEITKCIKYLIMCFVPFEMRLTKSSESFDLV